MSKSITAGIDFGNQTCVLSIPTRYGVDIVLNQSSNRKTPTMVGYQDERRFSGEFALQQQMMNINNTITNLKQLVGLPYNSKEREELSEIVPYKIVCLEENGLSGIQLENNAILRPEQVIGYLLKSLQEIIQMKNPKIEQLVLTIPPWWTELQKRTLLAAASISKIKIASLIDTTTAAAVSYVKIHSDRFLKDPAKKSNVIFIDLGDTSLNVSVTSLSQKSIEIKGFAYDKTINGQFFTTQLQNFLLKKVQEKYKIDLKTNKRSILRFQKATEKVKKALSANSIMMFEIPSLVNDIDVSIPIKREEFNELFQSHIEKVTTTIKNAIKKSNLTKDEIDAVEVLGGGSRIPAIKNVIKEFFGFDPMMSLDLDECFAVGAGFMAAKNDGYDIGIERIGGVCHFDVDAEFEAQFGREKKTMKTRVIKSGSKTSENFTFSVPVLNRNTVSLICQNEKIGCIEVQTGVGELIDVDVTVSFDSFGLVKVKKISTKKKDEKENMEENKEKNQNDRKEEDEEKEEKKGTENEEDKNEGEINGENKDDEKNFKKDNLDKIENKNTSDLKSENFNGSFEYSPFIPISPTSVTEFAKIEEELEIRDKKEIEIDDTKNELESFIFKMVNDTNSFKITSEIENVELNDIKEKVNNIFLWFSENEFERLELDDYKAKISEMTIQMKRLNQQKKFQEIIESLNNLRDKLTFVLNGLLSDKEMVLIKESIDLQSLIKEQISKIDIAVHSDKNVVLQLDVVEMEKMVDEIESRSKSLKNIQLGKGEVDEKKIDENELNLDKEEKVSLNSENQESSASIKMKKEKSDENSTKEETKDSNIQSSTQKTEKSTKQHNLSTNENQKETTSSSHKTQKEKTEEKSSNSQQHEEKLSSTATTTTTASHETSNTHHHHQNSSHNESNDQNSTKYEDFDKRPNTNSMTNEMKLSSQPSKTIQITEPSIDLKRPDSIHQPQRIHIKKSSTNQNKNKKESCKIIKVDQLKKSNNRPFSNNLKQRVKLPPLLSLDEEESDVLFENKMKKVFDSFDSDSPLNSPLPIVRLNDNETTLDRNECGSKLPPLVLNSSESKLNENFNSIKAFKKPTLPNQKRRGGQFLRFHTP